MRPPSFGTIHRRCSLIALLPYVGCLGHPRPSGRRKRSIRLADTRNPEACGSQQDEHLPVQEPGEKENEGGEKKEDGGSNQSE